jgi:hypothetical protein
MPLRRSKSKGQWLALKQGSGSALLMPRRVKPGDDEVIEN